MLSSGDMDYSGSNHVLQENIKVEDLPHSIFLTEDVFWGTESCRTFEARRNLSVDKTSNQNSVIQFFHRYFTRGGKFSETSITRGG